MYVSDKLDCHDRLAANRQSRCPAPGNRNLPGIQLAFSPPVAKASSLSAAAVVIPISATVVAPVPMFPAIAAVPVVSFTDVPNDRPSRTTRGGSHCSTFPGAACQPTDDSAARRTNAGALFRLAACCQRQANEYA